MGDHAHKHKHGEMDISEQERTFDGFMKFLVWGIMISIGTLVFLALANA